MAIVLVYCQVPKRGVNSVEFNDSATSGRLVKISAEAGKGHNHPSFVIWQENLQGEVMRTLFVTKSYASGIFGHENVDDSLWLDRPGKSYQPSALPYWTERKGLIDGKTYIPTPENPYVDAVTGATPEAGFSLKVRLEAVAGTRILMEVNQAWDWNEYWTNDRIPNNDAYKHSAQPSLIFAVTIDTSDSVFYLNPIGHGDPTGSSGKLYTDLSGFTTAREIFKNIKITIEN
ncbi:MAG: hypothetical protein JXR34_05075 [Bacteroidales bacterium]|nr:hypothetical protein [Bacteroidales bacterium]